MRAPEVRQQLVTVGSESVSGTPEQFAGYIRSEIAKWREVIHNAGIKPNDRPTLPNVERRGISPLVSAQERSMTIPGVK